MQVGEAIAMVFKLPRSAAAQRRCETSDLEKLPVETEQTLLATPHAAAPAGTLWSRRFDVLVEKE